MGKFTCPYCYGEHTLLECEVKCSYTIPGTTATCKRGVPKDRDGFIPNNKKSSCMACKDASKLVFCPTIYHAPDNTGGEKKILREIPREFLEGQSLPIALVGAKSSGKSNYIAVLINEIRRKMSIRFNCTLSISCSEESRGYYQQNYYQPIFEQGTVVMATDLGETPPPLIFPVRFLDNKNRIKNMATLTFYDSAGENFDSTEDMLIYNRYVPNSRGIILLLDPLQVDSIRKQLTGKMTLPNKNTDVNEVLSRIVDNIRRVKNVKGQIKIPLAIAFTKLDALEQFDILPQESCLREESEHIRRGVFVNSDFEAVDNEMRAILENFLDAELIQLMKNFEKSAFFGVSALGEVPSGGIKLSSEIIKPRRVLDPLLWLLAENKYIPRMK